MQVGTRANNDFSFTIGSEAGKEVIAPSRKAFRDGGSGYGGCGGFGKAPYSLHRKIASAKK